MYKSISFALYILIFSIAQIGYTNDNFNLITTVESEYLICVGDVNGDGYDDLMNELNLYLGSASFDTTADLSFPHILERVGCIAGNGDLNGDGYSDIVISYKGDGIDCYKRTSRTDRCYDGCWDRTYIHYGGIAMDTTPDIVIATHSYDGFGSSISIEGDVNGDGYDDLIGFAHPISDVEHVYIYYGSAEMDSLMDRSISFKKPITTYSGQVKYGGDINNDGYDDILIGGDEGLVGNIYLLYGGEEINPNTSEHIQGKGFIFSGVGDVNFDNYDDWVTMSINNKCDLYSGRNADFHFSLPIDSNEYNSSKFKYRNIITGGDINIDGISDIIIGNANENQICELYFGGTDIDSIPDDYINISVPIKYIPTSINFLGNINGDEFNEISIGTFQYKDSTDEGIYKSYIYSYLNINNINQEKPNADLPLGFQLFQNYPNPFNPSTTIKFKIEKPDYITLKIYNLLGQEIEILISQYLTLGDYKIKWEPKDLSTGVYFYQLKIGNHTETKKLLIYK